jgi:hypothetical protein
VTLAAGTEYQWRIQSWINVSGDWGGFTTFTTQAVPGQATRTAPTDGDTLTTATPTFEWNPVPGTAQYAVQVNNASGMVYRTWYTATACGCADEVSTCSITPTATLANNNYDWWVRTWNTFGYGPWSTKGDFTVDVP